MKHPSAFVELITLSVFTVAFIPLLFLLIYQMRLSKYTFLEDKTKIDKSAITYIEQDISYIDPNDTTFQLHHRTMYVPNVMVPTQYTMADMLLSLVIFDEYAPSSNIVTKELGWNEAMTTPRGSNKIVDMTLFDNYVNREDYLSSWYSTILNLESCSSSSPMSHVKSGHLDGDVPMYLNYYSDGAIRNGEKTGVWSFDHSFIDRVGVE